MNLDQLIAEGEEVRKHCYVNGSMGSYLTGERYEVWISKGILYLENNEPVSHTLEERFKEAAKKAVGNGVGYLDTMQGVLKALKEFGQE